MLWKENLYNYSQIIFYYYNKQIHSKLKAFLTNVSKMFLLHPASSVPLGDVTRVLFHHRIAESVSPLNLIHLGPDITLSAPSFHFFSTVRSSFDPSYFSITPLLQLSLIELKVLFLFHATYYYINIVIWFTR